MKSFNFIWQNIMWTVLIAILPTIFIGHLSVFGAIKEHFFYQKSTGLLMIDGSVKGKSDPITVDMKATRFICAKRQFFIFRFCPDQQLLKQEKRCEDGIAFCYDPILVEEETKPQFVLQTNSDLEISKRCGELFRGFKVSLKWMYSMEFGKQFFYEIQTGYESEPYYFVMPTKKRCISLWLGNEFDLSTSVRNEDMEELFPVQVRKLSGDSNTIGALNSTYNADLPEPSRNEGFGDQPSLRMLYLDFKSREFSPQMMFTVGPENSCNLYAQIRSNNVGKCSAGFKQKTSALRPYGHNTTSFYTLILESGVETNETKGTKSKMEKILDKEYSTTTMEETAETQTDPSIQSYEENVQGGEEKILSHVTKPPVEKTEDITPAWKKAAAAAINTAAALACGALSFFTAGFASCSANVEFKDVQTTKFHESFTKSSTNTKKTSHSSTSTHSVQQVLQTAFTHTKGSSESTSRSEQRSMSNAVTKRTVFVYEIEVPNDKILTPMQMSVNCDNSRVSIPWIKFKLTDIDQGFSNEDYGEDEEKVDIDDEKPATNDNQQDSEYDLDLGGTGGLKKQTQQEIDADNAFNAPPAAEEDEYGDLNLEGKMGGGKQKNNDNGEDDVYSMN